MNADAIQPFAALPLWFWAATAFLVAACVGSFLNVVVARVPREQSIAWPPSHCFTCGAPIAARHNLPILSWFLLRGRCHDCRAPFSIRYALVELAFAALCTFAVVRHGGPTHAALQECVLLGFLLALSCIDLDTWLLPHCLTIPGIAAGLLLALPLGLDSFLNRLLAAAIGYTVLLIGAFIGERVLGKEAMGGGDLFLFALIGAFLGTRALLPVIFLASLQGAAVGLALIAKREAGRIAPAQDVGEIDVDVEGDGRASAAAEAATGASPAASEEMSPARAQGQVGLAGVAPNHVSAGSEAEGAEPPCGAPAAMAAEQVAAPADAAGASLRIRAKIPDDGWEPDAHAIPFGPFLALGAAEVLYFSRLPDLLFPWIS